MIETKKKKKSNSEWHPPSPLHFTRLKCHLLFLRCNGVTQGQKSLGIWLPFSRLLDQPLPRTYKMSGTDPSAPPFVPEIIDLQDELSAPAPTTPFGYVAPFRSGGASSSSTPMTRSVTPKRPRTKTSPPPPPADTSYIDWAEEWRTYMRNQGAQGPQLDRFHPTTFATMMVKLESRTQAITEAFTKEMTALKAEVTNLRSQVAAFESVVDAVIPEPIPAPPPVRRRPAPPAAAAAKPVS